MVYLGASGVDRIAQSESYNLWTQPTISYQVPLDTLAARATNATETAMDGVCIAFERAQPRAASASGLWAGLVWHAVPGGRG